MNQSMTTCRMLENWVQETRSQSHALASEADSLQGRLLQLSHRQHQINALSHEPLTVGLYGHSVAGKSHLLKALLAQGQDFIGIQLGDKILNYFRHINPNTASARMAIRLAQTPPPGVDNYPLLLNLFAEYELAMQLVRQYHSQDKPRVIPESTMDAKLAALKNSGRGQPAAGMSREEFSAISLCYQQLVRSEYYPDDGLLYQMAELAPKLALNQRAELLSLFWGEESSYTQSWLERAHTLHLLGNTRQIHAPASLVVDDFLQPVEGFLVPSASGNPPESVDVIVCSMGADGAPVYLNIAQQALAGVCSEVVFSLSHCVSPVLVDIVDIPLRHDGLCTNHLQPDILMMCNAVVGAHQVTSTANDLSNWLSRTESNNDDSLPRLVWAITPFDSRFAEGMSYDDNVQRILTQSGKRWGTLQAVESHSLNRLREWLASAVNPTGRSLRQQNLQQQLQLDVNAQLAPISNVLTLEKNAEQQAQALVRALQSQAARQGELLDKLTLPWGILRQCWQRYQHQRQPLATQSFTLDLFAEQEEPSPVALNDSSFAQLLHKRWINYLRQLGYRQDVAEQLGLTPVELQALCDLLIATSYRLALENELEDALSAHETNAALATTCAGNALNAFIGWVGYQKTALERRPASRINKGLAIFAPPPQATAARRLTQLGERGIQGNSGYLYDWLVALYVRAVENAEHMQWDLNEEHKAALAQALGE